MRKILFIDIDDVLVLDRVGYSGKDDPHYSDFPYMYKHDSASAALLTSLFVGDANLYGVLHSTWRKYPDDWLKKHFEIQNTFVRWHESFRTDIRFDRWDSITSWLEDYPEFSNSYAIIDDEQAPVHLEERAIKINPDHGIDHGVHGRICELLQLDWK